MMHKHGSLFLQKGVRRRDREEVWGQKVLGLVLLQDV